MRTKVVISLSVDFHSLKSMSIFSISMVFCFNQPIKHSVAASGCQVYDHFPAYQWSCHWLVSYLYHLYAGRLRLTVNFWKLSTLWIIAFCWVYIIERPNICDLSCLTAEIWKLMDWEFLQKVCVMSNFDILYVIYVYAYNSSWGICMTRVAGDWELNGIVRKVKYSRCWKEMIILLKKCFSDTQSLNRWVACWRENDNQFLHLLI